MSNPSRPEESFRVPRAGPLAVGLSGLVMVGLGVELFVTGNAHHSESWAFAVAGGFALIGVGMIVNSIARLRVLVSLSNEGIRFSRRGRTIPWGQVGAIRSGRFGAVANLVDHQGSILGAIPHDIEEFDRAILLVSEHILGIGAGAGQTQFEGSYGGVAWLALIAVAAASLWELDLRRFPSFRGPAILTALVLLALVAFKVARLWRRTGEYRFSIDREGVCFDGRIGEWNARWGEIQDVTLVLGGLPQGGYAGVVLRCTDGRRKEIPLRKIELLPVLVALRRFGGNAAGPLVPPLERPMTPIFRREL